MSESEVLSRFLKYVTFDTQSNEASQSYPSTATQLTLLEYLADELRHLGLTDAAMDQYGYVTATIPSTSAKPDVPTI
jgi:tripeptide aminopeptidase